MKKQIKKLTEKELEDIRKPIEKRHKKNAKKYYRLLAEKLFGGKKDAYSMERYAEMIRRVNRND